MAKDTKNKEKEKLKSKEATEKEASTASGTKLKVLLAEDEPFLSGMYVTKLQLEGFEVVSAVDGEDAMSKLKDHKFDVILLDIMMPKLNGFEVLKSIRGDGVAAGKSKSDVPVIILTNLGQKNDIEQGLLLGANDYIVKANFTPTQVVDKVKLMLKKPDKPGELN